MKAKILFIQGLLVATNCGVCNAHRSVLAFLVPPSTSTSQQLLSTREKAGKTNISKTTNLSDLVRRYEYNNRNVRPFTRNSQIAIVNGDGSGAMDKKMILRGGTSNSNGTEADDTKKSPSKLKKVILSTVLCGLAVAIACNREAIAQFDFKQKLATNLDRLASQGTKGLILYTLAFMLWEITVGVTTPCETAAGMAFGFQKGLIANVIGKTSGAIIAFLLGRYVLKDTVESKLEGNEYMELVQDSIKKTPVRVALIWRFSFLPEQIKNFGLAVLPVKLWQFALAVCMHGMPFTMLWTFMGNEMGMVVRGVIDSPTRVLKLLITGVYIFGFFISPSLVGLWIKGLRDEKLKKEEATKPKRK